MDERHAGGGAGPGDVGGAVAVDGEGGVRLRLGPVDGGVGGGVDDEGATRPGDRAPDVPGARDVEVGAGEPGHGEPPGRAGTHELGAHLPGGAEHEEARGRGAHRDSPAAAVRVPARPRRPPS